MNRIRALIVDDERLARNKIRTLLAAHDDVEVIGECANGAEAVRAIRQDAPDLLFLDVQMPGLDGFEVIRKLRRTEIPRIVFVTAHDEYAVQAFQLEAIDYLLKPFDRRRFNQALERVRKQLDGQSDFQFRERLLQLLSVLEGRSEGSSSGPEVPSGERLERFVVRNRDRMSFVEAENVDWIEAEGKYVRLHSGAQSHLLRESIGDLDKRLDSKLFLRIHRGTIVNLRSIREMYRGAGDDHVVELRDGTRLALSRRYRSKMKGL